MESMTAKPKLLKQANLSLIRKVIKAKNTATRAEIVKETKISTTTVRSLLTEMLQNGEIESIGYDESSGGRKAERYRIKPERYYCAAFCITDRQVHGLLANVYGEIVETQRLPAPAGNFEEAIVSYLDVLTQQKEIKAIGIGVPGVVEGGCYWRKNEQQQWCKVAIGDTLSNRYGVPVILENDLNAITVGFSQCYQKKFPRESPESLDLTYLHFEKGCVSAGFLSGGRLIRGYKHYAGELGLIPMSGEQTLDEMLSEPIDDARYGKIIIKIISWICGILNPQYIVLGGPDFRKNSIGHIVDGLFALLPRHMSAEILYSSDVWHDYYHGMAYLTAGKMFDEVHIVKE